MLSRRHLLGLSGAAAVGLGAMPWSHGWTAPPSGEKKRLLFFTRSQGFEHDVVKRGKPDDLAHAERILTELGQKHGFDVTASKDGRVFLPETLAPYDAIFFFTTGELTKDGGDGNPPMPQEGKKALLDAIAGGKGFLGSHCASDTFHSPGKADENQATENIDLYLQMLGGEFIVHGDQQRAWMRVTSPKFPNLAGIGDFGLKEEWYALKNFASDLHVILVQETDVMRGGMYQRPPFPATWARQHGQGRVFYTSMGHREDVWTNPLFQHILLGGLSWALGNVQADVAPNLEKAAPKARELKG